MSFAFHGWWMLIAWALACILLVGLVWITLPAALRRRYDPTPEENLRERMTAGELNSEEYRLRLAVLQAERRSESA
jgi:uncharacterized membrane protein